MEITKVTDKLLADICDEMLTSLIMDERKYDENIKEDLVVHDWCINTLKNENRVTFVAIADGEVVGFVHGFIKVKAGGAVKDSVIILDVLYVKEKHRKQGIATALIKEFKNWAKSVDAKYIDLTVIVHNNPAIELYRKNGFVPLKTYMRNVLK